MSNLDKNIIITPNVGNANDDPKIVFSAANTTANAQNITMRAYPTSNGTLSVEGSAGQLFSITNQLTGTLFSVNDISGIPSIQVQDTGQIQLATYGGNVVIGANTAANASTSNTTGGLIVYGGVGVTGNIYVGGTNAGANGIYTDVLRYAANGLPWVMGSGSGGGGGTGTGNANTYGWLANTIIVANSAGYLSNSNSFFVASNNAIVVPNVVITQTSTASWPLNFGSSLGNKIGLYDTGSGTGYGFGIQSGKLQIFTDGAGACTSFGYGSSSNFTETFRVASVTSAVNYLQVSGNTAGLSPVLSAQGSDTNVDVTLVAKGTGSTYIKTGGNTAFKIDGVYGAGSGATTAVNYWNPSGSAAGNGLRMDIGGSDADVSMFFITKGLGSIFFNSGGSSGTTQLKVSPTASAVNFVQVSGAAASGAPYILANGSDTDVPLILSSKNAGSIIFKTAGSAPTQFQITHTASAVNYLQVTGNSTANTPVLSAQGSDANVSMSLIPKGVGGVLINQTYNQGTGILQANGSVSVAGNTTTRNLYLSGVNNILTYSQDFTNAVWTKTNATISTGFTAPDGTVTAQKLVEDSSTTQHLITQYNGTIAVGTICTYSVYAKAAEWTSFQLQLGSGGALATFNLSAVTAVGTVGSVISATIISVGNGWYRCTLTGTYGNGSNYIYKNATTYAGDNVSGMYVWGAQIELGYVASAYTLTTTAAITNTNNLYVSSGNVYVGNTSSYSTTNNAITVAGSIGTANSIYVGNRVGYANANNISVVYQSYNSSTNSLDVVFG